jgi:multidrug efflux pump subunit AcrB
MQWLAQVSVKRPVFASVLVLSLVVVGVFAYFQLGVDIFPKVDFPIITVTTRQAGAAPEEIETEITDKVERAVNTIAGIEELRSVSTEGVSQVFIQFKLEKSVDVAAQEVRDRVNQILPISLRTSTSRWWTRWTDTTVCTQRSASPSASSGLGQDLRREIESISRVRAVTLVRPPPSGTSGSTLPASAPIP